MDLRQFYRGKRVLVTGNTGFKGAWLSAWLEDLGAVVGGLSKDVPTDPSAFEALGGVSRFPTAFVDLRDASATARAVAEFRPDLVFHLAAQAIVRHSYGEPVETWGTNVMGTLHLLEAVRRTPSILACGVVSSDKCYANDDRDVAYREDDRLGGKDPYSASKAGEELVFRSHYESYFRGGKTRVLSFRAGNVLGGGDWGEDRLVPDCVRAWKAERVHALRDPEATRPWQHVLEPLGGYLVALARAATDPTDRWNGESFNFGPSVSGSRTVGEVAEALAKRLPGFVHSTEGAGDEILREAKVLRISSEKIGKWAGWKPLLEFEETIEWTAEGYREDFPRHVAAKRAEYERRMAAAGLSGG